MYSSEAAEAKPTGSVLSQRGGATRKSIAARRILGLFEPHGGAVAPFYVSTNVPTKVSNKDFFSAAEPPERSQRNH